jgi:hypothetical protein
MEPVRHHTPHECLECGKSLASKRRDALTCSSRCRSRRWRRLQWHELRPGVRFRRVEASDDSMFNKVYFAFFPNPEED